MKLFKKHLLSALIVLIILIAQFALAINFSIAASGLEGQEGFSSSQIPTAFGGPSRSDPIKIAAKIINAAFALLGIIFVTLLIIAGYKYMTAQGNQDKVDEALKQIKHAAIGLLIILASWSITVFVFDRLLVATTGSVWGPGSMLD